MIGLDAYKIIHLAAVVGLFGAVGGVAVHAANGLAKERNSLRGAVSALHGVSLLLILVTGFGMLARLDAGLPAWAIAKLVLWFALGALLTLPYRSPGLARPVLWALPVLGAVAAWLAIYKPF
ncbi:MAG: hypothetical protein ABFS34_08890 [Gemmatimonadota bacterium]